MTNNRCSICTGVTFQLLKKSHADYSVTKCRITYIYLHKSHGEIGDCFEIGLTGAVVSIYHVHQIQTTTIDSSSTHIMDGHPTNIDLSFNALYYILSRQTTLFLNKHTVPRTIWVGFICEPLFTFTTTLVRFNITCKLIGSHRFAFRRVVQQQRYRAVYHISK